MKDVNPAYLDPGTISRNPFLADALLVNQGGARTISQITPSLVHNTIDNPIFPNAGKRFTLSSDFAGVGGDVFFLKPRVEGVWWKPTSRTTTFGVRGQVDYLEPYGSTNAINMPIYERLFLGGDTACAVTTSGRWSPRPRDVRRARRQQGRAVQRGVSLHDCRPFRVLATSMPASEGFRPVLRDRLVRDVDGRRGPVLHAGPERAFRLIYAHNMNREGIRQQPGARQGQHVQIRGGVDVLGPASTGRQVTHGPACCYT